MSTEMKRVRLAAAKADLEAAKTAQAHFEQRSRYYRELSAEQPTTQGKAAYTNASVQFSAQASGMSRQISELLQCIASLEREETGCAVELTPAQCAAMDDTMGATA